MARDPASTRAALLDAAREEFAAHGIAGARVDRIADRAGVNKQRIYGHFGSKEELFEIVLAEAIRELAGILADQPQSDPGAFVGRIYDYHQEHPTLLRLLLWQALQSTESKSAKGPSRPEGASADLLTLIGLASWPHAVPWLVDRILGGESSPEALRDHLVRFASRALESEEGASASAPG